MDVNGSLQIVNELSVGGNVFTAGTASLVLISNGSENPSSLSTHLAGSNIYNANGILTENRVVTQGAYTMSFVGTSTNGFSINGTTFSVYGANKRIRELESQLQAINCM